MPRIPAIAASAGQRHDITDQAQKAAETFKEGALLLMDANEDMAECGADPALIYGFALNAADKYPVTGRVLVQKLWEGQQVWMDGDNAPTKADINQSYGVTKDADGIWHVDGTKTAGSARVYVHEIDTHRNRYLVSVLAANRQVAP